MSAEYFSLGAPAFDAREPVIHVTEAEQLGAPSGTVEVRGACGRPRAEFSPPEGPGGAVTLWGASFPGDGLPQLGVPAGGLSGGLGVCGSGAAAAGSGPVSGAPSGTRGR